MKFFSMFFVSIFVRISDCYKILAVLPIASTSHHTLSVKLVDGLARKGHQVTFLTSYPRGKTPENVKEVGTKALEKWVQNMRKKVSNYKKPNFYQNFHYVNNMVFDAVEFVIEDNGVKEFLGNGSDFDVAIVAECTSPGYMAIGHHFRIPVVLFSTMPLFPWTSFRLGNPDLPSWVSNIYSKRLNPGNFWARGINAVHYIYSVIYDNFVLLPKYDQVIRKHLPENPDFYQNLRNVSLVLANSHPSVYEASLQMPNVVEIGGFHIEPPEPIPEDISTFLDNSPNGVVLFAMGSHCQMSKLPEATLSIFWETFGRLNQNILMKWESDILPKIPPNVKLVKWIPQKDVLAHPNIRVFITHGGLLSTLESLYFGVPVIGIPVSFDQTVNIQFAEFYGYGKLLSLENLTQESLSTALEKVLFNSKYLD